MRYALNAEWTKLRTLKGTAWLMVAIVASTVAVSALTVGTTTCPATGCTQDTVKQSLTGVQLGQAIVAILAVLAISGEYTSGMIRTTLTAMPRRTTVLAAKAAILSGLVLAAGSVAVLGSLLAGRFILAGHGYGGGSLPLADGLTLRAAVGSVLYLVLIALLSLGLATAVRDPAVGIGSVLALLYLFPIMMAVVSDPHWQKRVFQIAPMTAGMAIQTTKGVQSVPIGPWKGLGVVAAWAVAAMLLGGVLLRKRDA